MWNTNTPQLHRGLKPQNVWHGRSWTPQPEKRWARGGYRAAFPAQGQSNPSKSLAGWLCSLSSSQSPASGSLAMCLPLGRTRGRIWGSKKSPGIGKMLLPRTSFNSFSLKMKSSIFQTTGIWSQVKNFTFVSGDSTALQQWFQQKPWWQKYAVLCK